MVHAVLRRLPIPCAREPAHTPTAPSPAVSLHPVEFFVATALRMFRIRRKNETTERPKTMRIEIEIFMCTKGQ